MSQPRIVFQSVAAGMMYQRWSPDGGTHAATTGSPRASTGWAAVPPLLRGTPIRSRLQVRAAQVEAPPRGVRRPGEQPQRQIAIGKAQVRCNVGTCSCGEAPAIDAREYRAQADRRIEVGQRAAGAVVVDLADHGNHESELASPAGAGEEPVPFVRASIMEGSGLHRHGAVAGLRSEPPWLQAMLLPVEPTGYAWRSLSAVPTAHRLLLGARLPFANVHRYQTGRRGNHSHQANAAGGSVPVVVAIPPARIAPPRHHHPTAHRSHSCSRRPEVDLGSSDTTGRPGRRHAIRHDHVDVDTSARKGQNERTRVGLLSKGKFKSITHMHHDDDRGRERCAPR